MAPCTSSSPAPPARSIHELDVAELCVGAAEADRPEAEIPAGGPDVFGRREIAELA